MKNGEEVLSSEKQPEIESCFVSDPLFLPIHRKNSISLSS
jgi:hypothetical protein